MTKFTHKPITVDAYQLPFENEEVPEAFFMWANDVGFKYHLGCNGSIEFDSDDDDLFLCEAELGDWIVKHGNSVFTAIEPEEFERLYEMVR